MKHLGPLLTSAAVLASGLGLSACSSAPEPNANLDRAHQAYEVASSDPVVRKAAPRELDNAKDTFDEAHAAWSEKEDKATVDHLAYMSQRYSEIAQQAAKIRTHAISATTAARILTLSGMLFASGQADLNDEGTKAVGELATFMRNYPDRTIKIMGYTDSTGSAEINAALSAQRAAAVQNALVAQGIAASRIEARGFGPTNPVASNQTAEGRQKNRRVEVAISGQAEPVSEGASTPK